MRTALSTLAQFPQSLNRHWLSAMSLSQRERFFKKKGVKKKNKKKGVGGGACLGHSSHQENQILSDQ